MKSKITGPEGPQIEGIPAQIDIIDNGFTDLSGVMCPENCLMPDYGNKKKSHPGIVNNNP